MAGDKSYLQYEIYWTNCWKRIVFIQTVTMTSDCVKQEVNNSIKSVSDARNMNLLTCLLVHSKTGCVRVCQQGAVIKLLLLLLVI